MLSRHPTPARIVLLFLFAGTLLAANPSRPPDFIHPDAIARAAREGLPIRGITPPAATEDLRPGDAIVALVTLQDPRRPRQWLAEFRVEALTAAEQAAPAAAVTVHTSAGGKFDFSSRLAALGLRLFGPFDLRPDRTPSPPTERTARLLVKTDFLAAGFARHCELILRLRDSGIELPVQPSGKPFPAKRIAHDRAVADRAGLSPDDERVLAATGPALGEFLGIAQSTPVLKDLLRHVADFPPLWGLLFGGPSGFFFEPSGIERASGSPWDLATDTPVYRAPFHYYVRGGKVLQGEFHFTSPRPPLLTSAGILAVRVASPKNPQRSLELRVLSARRGAP